MSVYKWRLKDAKLNSRGLLSPWKPRHTPIENRLEDGNRQRIQRSSPKKYVLLYNKRRQYRVDGHPELVSGSVRGEGQDKARCQMLKQVQHDIWRHLLFIPPFWKSQFNTYVKTNTRFSFLCPHIGKWTNS